jgi:hypothetical protein
MPKREALLALVLMIVLGGITWTYAQQSKTAGSLTTQDYVDIQQLYARYYTTIDAGQAEAWAGTFTADGVFNTTTRGHDALAAFIRRSSPNGRPMRHWHTNLMLTATPEGATGSVYVMQIDIRSRPPAVATYSRYDDALVKTPQGWRFKTRQRSSDTTIGTEPAR